MRDAGSRQLLTSVQLPISVKEHFRDKDGDDWFTQNKVAMTADKSPTL